MVTKYQVINFFEKNKENPYIKFMLDEKHENVIHKDTGKHFATIDEYIGAMKKVLHCDFELIYEEHPSLMSIIRCKECGTVIFTRDDESYDPNLNCPTCSDYKTYFEYWTKEEIDNDEKKQNTIKLYQEIQHHMEESYKRTKKRGLQDWEIWKKKIKFKKTMWIISLECNNLFHTKIKGLKLCINKYEKDPDSINSYIYKKHIRIPLSFYAFYIQFILPYKKNTHPSVRKYHFWQKKKSDDNSDKS